MYKVYCMRGAGIIIYHVDDTTGSLLILIGTEGKYLANTNPYIRQLERVPSDSDSYHYCVTMAKKLSNMSKHRVHVDKISSTPHFVHITSGSRQGIIKGGMDKNDRYDMTQTIIREMIEEIGISITTGVRYLCEYDDFTLFSLMVDGPTRQSIESSISNMESNHQGELFDTRFIPFEQIEWDQLNFKSKKALQIFSSSFQQ